MKKLMTSVIILLPLIILLIMLVSGAIIGFITHIYVESVEFAYNDTLVLLLKDESQPPRQQLAVNVFPLEADNRSLRFTVEDDSVAQVSNDGTLTAKYFGETYVRVTSTENAAATASLKVIVTDTAVHALAFDSVNNDMYVGETQRFAVRVIPQEAVTGVEFTSDNVAVLSVNKITGDAVCHGAGTATITATSTENPAVSTQITVTCHEPLVSAAVSVSSVVTAQLTAQFPALTVYPANATYNVTYSVSDDSVASVDGNGNITFAKAGFVTVTATAADGRGHSASAAVNYRCTYGYYLGNLFEKTDYTFDYDQYKGKVLSDIVLRANPDGAYRQIIDVSFSGSAGLISFNSANNTFTLNNVGDEQPLGVVQIVIHARKYDTATEQLKEFTTDVCTVTVTRNTQSVSFVGADGNALSAVNVRSRSVNIGELLSPDARPRYLGVVATPFNHTDKLSYALADTSVATLDGTILTFNGTEGTANLTVGVKDGDNFTVYAQVAVTYLAPVNSDVQVNVDTEHVEQSVALEIHDNGTKQSALLDMNTPEGYVAEYDVTEGKDVVTVQDNDGVVRFVPQKGGFATITIKLVPAGSAHSGSGALGYPRRAATEVLTEYTVEIYVDREVPVDAISFDVADGLRIAGKQVNYTITLNVDPADGIMEGKELFVNDSKVQLTANAQSYTYTGTYNIENLHGTITAQVRYGDKALELLQAAGSDAKQDIEGCRRSIKVESTNGKIDQLPTVTVKESGQQLQNDSTLEFGKIGQQITLSVSTTNLSPSDIVLNSDNISFDGATKFKYQINEFDDHIEIVLTSTEGGEEDVTLTIAKQTLRLHVSSKVIADTISVWYGIEQEISADKSYYTMLNELTFTVKLGSSSGKALTDTTVKYAINGSSDWKELHVDSANTVTCTISTDGITSITFAVGAQPSVTLTVNVCKVDPETVDYKYTVQYAVNSGETVTAFDFTLDNNSDKTIDYTFPRDVFNDCFKIVIKANLDANSIALGDYYADQFNKLFTFGSMSDPWSTDYDVATKTITVTMPTTFANQDIQFSCGSSKSVHFNLTRSDLGYIQFNGYDSSSYEDNHKGYQQVRVFAKHSYYNGATVDYILIPLKALVSAPPTDLTAEQPAAANLDALTITLTKYNSKAGTNEVLVTQRGTTVTAGNDVYTIVRNSDGTYRLDKNGSPVVRDGKYVDTAALDIPWIDVYSQGAEGYARLYFGNFTGLSESDVQNDYFGNFFERAEWSEVEDNIDNYDGSGRTFAASEGAYSYLRMQIGDGVEDVGMAKNAHFNFNVLQDNALVNVFNATGYYNNSKVVLQNNLYGAKIDNPSSEHSEENVYEVQQTEDNKNQFISSTNKAELNKSVIYGNGYSVNFNAYNQQLIKNAPNDRNNSDAITVGNVYNAKVKGANATTTIDTLRQKLVLIVKYAYYSDLQYYTKCRPENAGTAYIKNTVLHAASQSGFQLFYSGEKAYFEDVTVVECAAGITNEQSNVPEDHETNFYFKGNIDVLNYTNLPGILKMASASESLAGTLGMLVDSSAWANFEYFGKKCASPSLQAYVNLVIYTSNTKGKFNFWNGNAYDLDKKESVVGDNVPMKQILDLSEYKSSLGGSEVTTWTYDYPKNKKLRLPGKTYDYTVTVDGRSFTSSTGTQYFQLMFTEDRYIRLLCQYTNITDGGTNLVKNTDHIMWHIQQVYRDVNLIDGRNNNHIEALKESIMNKGIVWPDNTTPEQALEEYENYQNTNGANALNGEAVEDVAAAANALASHTILPERKEYC